MSDAGPAAVAIEARALSHRFGARTAFPPLDFAAAGPGVVAVTGPNGSGKSTLLRILAGLLRPTAGAAEVRLAGEPVAAGARRAAVGLASPELAFYEELTAAENLAFAAETRGLADRAGAAGAALARVGLAARGGDRVAAYSSGMKQRLRLAFALLHGPALLLLDEPGSHLDAAGRGLVREVVRAHARTGLVVLATNDPEERALAERDIALGGRGLGDPA